MKLLLDMNGVIYSRVSLQSACVASVSLTFQVDLGDGDQSESMTRFSRFLGNSEAFPSFSDYTVMEGGRGLVDISVSGIVAHTILCIGECSLAFLLCLQKLACVLRLTLAVHFNCVVELQSAHVTVWMLSAR